jgi:Cof subfamily protein (haloacid dehalogenase superfamily)
VRTSPLSHTFPRVPRRLSLEHRVVSLDLDGTILPRDFRLRPFTVEVLAALRRGGVDIVINTGRMFRSALPYAEELELTGPLICYQGALIKMISTGEVLRHEPLALDVALDVLGLLEPGGHSVNVYVDDILHVERITPDIARYLSVANVEVREVGRLSEFLSTPTTKIVVGGEPDLLDRVAESLRSAFPDLYVLKSLPFFLEIGSPLVSKSSGLAYLGERWGFGRGDVVAFGDSYNDIDMLAWAATPDPVSGLRGLGVAVANAPEEVRSAGNAVCASVDDEGVARFLLDLAVPA